MRGDRSTGALFHRREHGGTRGEGDDCDEEGVFAVAFVAAFVTAFVALPRSHCFKAVDAEARREGFGWGLGAEVDNQEAGTVEDGEEDGADFLKVVGRSEQRGVSFGLMGVEQEHEGWGASADGSDLAVGDGAETGITPLECLTVRGAADGCGSFGGGGESVTQVAVENGCAVVAGVVDDDRGAGTCTAVLFEGGYDGFLGGGELPAEKFPEAVAPYVGDARLTDDIGCYEPP